jgi:halocyanin-like protein
MDETPNRRAFLTTAALSGACLLAGCGGSDGTATPAGSAPDEVATYLADTDNFDGSLQDETGTDSVSVDVGAPGNGGNFGFAPPAIRVDTGTTVTWVWTGEGNMHNVVHEGGDFESQQTAEEGFEFEHTFDEAGTYRYACTPHAALGMKGAVVVE